MLVPQTQQLAEVDVIKLLAEGLQKTGIEAPRIGIAGLNPHAGDNGLFGDEEIKESCVVLKDMLASTQKKIKIAELINNINFD